MTSQARHVVWVSLEQDQPGMSICCTETRMTVSSVTT